MAKPQSQPTLITAEEMNKLCQARTTVKRALHHFTNGDVFDDLLFADNALIAVNNALHARGCPTCSNGQRHKLT